MGQIICDIKRNAGEIIRLEVSDFKGHELINMRIWYSSIDENTGDLIYKPTQKGFALNIDKFDELKTAVAKLEQFIRDKQQGIQPEQFAEAKVDDTDEKDMAENSEQ